MTGTAGPAQPASGPDGALAAVIQRIIGCPSASTLRPRSRHSFGKRMAAVFPAGLSWAARDCRLRLEIFLARPEPGLCIIGPGVHPTVHGWLAGAPSHVTILDVSGSSPGPPGLDPRRRTLNETWFTPAKAAAELALDVMQSLAPHPWGAEIERHHSALLLRLKIDIGLRLRRLQIVSEAAASLGVQAVFLIEGEQPLDDLEAHFLATGATVTRCPGPAEFAARRHGRRLRPAAPRPSSWPGFEATVRRWKLPHLDLGGKAVIVGDLRRKVDFRHSQTVRSLLEASAAEGALLLQPYTRHTANVLRAAGLARQLGATMTLVRQPQATSTATALAGVRSELLRGVDAKLVGGDARYSAGERAAILEGCGGFIASNLAPSLALLSGLTAQFLKRPPRFIASVPLGSPFGGLIVSAGRAAGVPTVEVQTLMIGISDRDPMPVAERVAVLDVSQRDIFQRRFGIEDERFILAGHVEMGGPPHQPAPTPPPPPRSVLFASQPLDGVSAAALEIVTAACSALGSVSLSVSPHPDETAADIVRTQEVLDRWPDVESRILPAGGTIGALGRHAVLCTILSNVALRAAQQGGRVLVINPGVTVPVDFARLGLALSADSVEAAQRILGDFFEHGPETRRLEESQARYFVQNPQLTQGGAADRIVAAMQAVRPLVDFDKAPPKRIRS